MATHEEIVAGIEMAAKGIPKYLEDEALEFFQHYALNHRYFTGGDVLAAWRKRINGADSNQDWRNRWGAITVKARTNCWIKKVGRMRPPSSQSHTATLAKWESLLYEGDAPEENHVLKELMLLKSDVIEKKSTFIQALWAAYELGRESD
jgi:hypothetical protein